MQGLGLRFRIRVHGLKSLSSHTKQEPHTTPTLHRLQTQTPTSVEYGDLDLLFCGFLLMIMVSYTPEPYSNFQGPNTMALCGFGFRV